MTILPKKKSNQPKDGGGRTTASGQQQGTSTSATSVAAAVDHLMSSAEELSGVSAASTAVSAPPHRKRTNPSGSSLSGNRTKSRNNNATLNVIPKSVVPQNIEKTEPESSSKCGYNSEDEYERSGKHLDYSEEKERKFEEKLSKAKGWNIKRMKEDGACLFRAVADQVYGDQEMNGVVRKLCMDYMAKNSDHFSQFVTEDFKLYIARKRQDTSHGNHTEIQALAEMYNRPIEVYQYSLEPINTFYTNLTSQPPNSNNNIGGAELLSAPMRVTYHGGMHYNSLVDPLAATIGVGLGLPQFQPGAADRSLLRDAEHASERDEIERVMLKDKLLVTDWEATDEQLQEQVARESYLEWIRTQEKVMKESATSNRGESTVTRPHKAKSPSVASLSGGMVTRSSKPSSPAHEPCHTDASEKAGPSHGIPKRDNASANKASSTGKAAPSLYGTSSPWVDDEDDMINQVLALSRQEYFDTLKNTENPASSSSTSAGAGNVNLACVVNQVQNFSGAGTSTSASSSFNDSNQGKKDVSG